MAKLMIMHYSRRHILSALLGSAIVDSWPITGAKASENTAQPGRLRSLAAARGVIFGAAASSWALKHDPALAALYAQEAAMIVPEYEMKWGTVRAEATTFSYAAGDFLVGFAAEHGLGIRGHCLAWNDSNPDWMNAMITKDNAEQYLTDHIQRLAGRYSGRMHSWDVVNEPIQISDGMPDGLRDGIWLRTLGPHYIDIAFRAARAADPHALLVLNEAATERSRRKRKYFLKLLDRLQRNNVPIDAVGLECHHGTGYAIDGEDFFDYLSELAGRGYKTLITELDVSDVDERSSAITTRDDAVSQIYGSVVSAAIRSPALIAILTWGLSDKYSWYRNPSAGVKTRSDGSPLRPLPFDDEMRPKPAWEAMIHAFSN